jgi:Holliday junction resolvase
MNTETYERLKKLYDEYGPQEFGKLCQKFLALAFQAAGYTHIIERGVQGVDIDAANAKGEKYAVEVKTTATKTVVFDEKDVTGLEKRKEDGYQPVVAVLRLDRFSNWLFAKADAIKAGTIIIDSLRSYRHRELESCVCPVFEKAVKDNFKGALEEGQMFLDKVLRQKGAEVRSL